MSEGVIEKCELLRLSVFKMGPFQDEVQVFDLARLAEGDAVATAPNMYMLLAKNGLGKTTALEAIYGLFALMNDPQEGCFLDPETVGQAQLDLRLDWRIGPSVRTVVLSIWTGRDDPLLFWNRSDLIDWADTTDWARLCLTAGAQSADAAASNELGLGLFRLIRDGLGSAPDALRGGSQSAPCVLLFPADRRLVAPTEKRVVERPNAWNYQPARRFSSDGEDWGGSIDNLLVWLQWLDDGRLQHLLDEVNRTVFSQTDHKRILPPDRAELRTYVRVGDSRHPLTGLSHGERAILQLYARVLCHMTANTIVLIDEFEIHLHPKLMLFAFGALKSLVGQEGDDMSNLSVVFTTHDMELMRFFGHEIDEDGLRKGGFLVEAEIE